MVSPHIMFTLKHNKMNTGAVHVNTRTTEKAQVFGLFVGLVSFFAKHDSLTTFGWLSFCFSEKVIKPMF